MLESLKLKVDLEAGIHTVEGLIEALTIYKPS